MARRAYKGPDGTCSATTGLLGALTPLTKLGELEKFAHHVCTHITSKRIEFITKPDQPGLSSSICFEVVMEQS